VQNEGGPASVPARIAQFRILGLLGRGGMGAVYRAHDETLRRDVALKLLPTTGDEERRHRFLREARSAAALTHPNVAVVYEVGDEAGRVYIAMELIEGESLRQRMDRGRIDPASARGLAEQIARGLAAAHDKGIVHRDLKPENVMITREGVVKLLDFGLAKSGAVQSSPGGAEPGLAKTETLVTSEEGRIMGTPEYMSPEQATGEMLDVRSDVFSFGVVLYEMVSGVRPFRGATPAGLLVALIRDREAPLRERVPDVDPQIASIVDTCLAKTPADRYSSASAVLGVLGQRQSTTHSGAALPPTTTLESASGAGTGDRGRRPRFSATAVTVGAVAAFALAAFAVARVSRVPPGPAPQAAATAATTTTATSAAAPASAGSIIRLADLAPSKASVPGAEASYRRAMQLLGRGEDAAAAKAMREAVTTDPDFASAHLELLILATYNCPTPLQTARPHFQAASRGRSALSERERDVLDAIEPAVLDPPDLAQVAVRMRALAAKRPNDVEVIQMLGVAENKLFHFDRSAEAARREIAMDPEEESFATLILAQDLDSDEGRRALDQCLQRNPAAQDCRIERAFKYAALGACHEEESEARAMTVYAPDSAMGPYMLAAALAGQNASVDALRLALDAKRSTLPPAVAERVKAGDDMELAVWTGDFASARSGLAALAAPAQPPSSFDRVMRVDVLWESGDARGAGDLAMAFVKEAPAMPRVERPEADPLPHMLARARQGGALSEADFVAQRDAWIASWRRRLDDEAWTAAAPVIWGLAFSYPANEDDARAAVERLPSFGGAPPPIASRRFWTNDGPIGELLLMGGRIDDALARLRPAAHQCSLALEPIRAQLRLGEALEKTGDVTGACSSFATVLSHWGHAKPRSLTADEARAHAQKLGCAL
jgi:serine/threonine-protein kinase